MAINYYRRSSSNISYYSSDASSSEPNIREEFIDTINGSSPEIAKGHYVIFRKATRDANNNVVHCECVDLITKEPDKDRWCPYCYSTGLMFTEEFIKAYSVIAGIPRTNAILNNTMPFGNSDLQYKVFYTMYDKDFTVYDRLIEVELDNEGNVVEPINRIHIFKIIRPYAYRLDNGKLEYWKIYITEEDVKWLNAPNS
jgi:hypothetical protein